MEKLNKNEDKIIIDGEIVGLHQFSNGYGVIIRKMPKEKLIIKDDSERFEVFIIKFENNKKYLAFDLGQYYFDYLKEKDVFNLLYELFKYKIQPDYNQKDKLEKIGWYLYYYWRNFKCEK